MFSISYIFFAPLILLVSIFLALFAAITTSLAFSTLFIRVFIVYAELAAAIIQDNLTIHTSSHKKTTATPSSTTISERRRKSRRSSAASASSTGSLTPKAPKTSGLGVYGGEGAARDFEGVGGWRVPGPDGEDELWTSLNYRLELPAAVDGGRPNHHRSRTAGSAQLSLTSHDLAPLWTPHEGSFNREGRLNNRGLSKSTTALDAAAAERGDARPKPSTYSSASSHSSAKTAHLILSNA